jgi:hypothetical protein
VQVLQEVVQEVVQEVNLKKKILSYYLKLSLVGGTNLKIQ